jgi:hypothetical protein
MANCNPSTLLQYVKELEFPANGASTTQNICDVPISNMDKAETLSCIHTVMLSRMVQALHSPRLRALTLDSDCWGRMWLALSSSRAISISTRSSSCVHLRFQRQHLPASAFSSTLQLVPNWATSKRHCGKIEMVECINMKFCRVAREQSGECCAGIFSGYLGEVESHGRL